MEPEIDIPNWAYGLISLAVAILIRIGIFIYCKYKHFMSCTCLEQRRKRKSDEPSDEQIERYTLVSTKSRDDEQFPTVKPTAPAREPEAIELQNIVKKLYPTL